MSEHTERIRAAIQADKRLRAKARRQKIACVIVCAAAIIVLSCIAVHCLTRPIDGGRGNKAGYREGMNGAAHYRAVDAAREGI